MLERRLLEIAVLSLVAGPGSEAASPPRAAGAMTLPRTQAAPVAAARGFGAPEAEQAVAVSERHVYVIGSRVIGKYDKQTGQRLALWKGAEGGPVRHLNSGVIVDGKLYCAHSNYPEIPMTSSVEVWDAERLEHVGSHSFGTIGGSLTWLDRHAGHWWAGFAQYSGERAEPGKDPSWTQVVQLDERWQRRQGWVFPSDVVARLRPMSNSGASWGPDGLLHCTGHDRYETYAMRLPEFGSTLELVRVVPVASFGQGIAWDRTPGREGDLWGIVKDRREVRVTAVESVSP